MLAFSFLAAWDYTCVWQVPSDASEETRRFMHSPYTQSMAFACGHHQSDTDLNNLCYGTFPKLLKTTSSHRPIPIALYLLYPLTIQQKTLLLFGLAFIRP